jgi:hypothetical protein
MKDGDLAAVGTFVDGTRLLLCRRWSNAIDPTVPLLRTGDRNPSDREDGQVVQARSYRGAKSLNMAYPTI